ncbi:hypothetical protein EDB85DRAFT_2013981 [Lactarius pseudohatsudake]|nr:hypothetical protein EDB85DRAFT_2013981 [Lactarius pseudohatsudake]
MVLPSLSLASALAPLSSRERTVPVPPPDNAMCNGVHPRLFSAFMLAPWSSSMPTVSVSSLNDVSGNRALPSSVYLLPRVSSKRMDSIFPLDAAKCNGVHP